MIVALNGKWTLHTQTKCASNSLQSALVNSDCGVFVKPKHGMHPILKHEPLTCVRNPYDRWCSMYWYNYFRANMWGPKDLNEWAEFFFERRALGKNLMWTFTCSENCDGYGLKPFKGPQAVLDYLVEVYKERPGKLKRLNVEERRDTTTETLDKLTVSNLQKVHDWCALDCERFEYEKRQP